MTTNSELSGRELDRAIAVALGYRVIPNDQSRFGKGHSLINPRGEVVGIPISAIASYCIFDLEDEAWAAAPAFHADANAVLAVCSERGWRLGFGRNLKKDQPYAAIEWDDDDWDFVTVNAATPQEAGARALLAALTAEAET